MFEKILVPLDGSELAERALAPALALAEQEGGEVVLLQVPIYKQIMVPGTAGYGLLLPEQSLDRCRGEAVAYLEGLQAIHSRPDYKLRTRVEDGDVAGTIVDQAVEGNFKLIAMTTHGYSGLTRWMLGSVTERVLRGAPCPVLVIREKRPLANIVITLDGSRLAEKALAPGFALARLLGGQVTLLQIDTEEKLGAIERSILEVANSGLSQVAQAGNGGRHREYYLRNAAQRFQTAGVEVDTVVIAGEPAQGILSFCDSEKVDVIVMATHGHTGLRRWVYGSVTEKVLRQTTCAMLIVRPPDETLN